MMYKVLISRKLSSTIGMSSGIPVARVIQLCSGDFSDEWNLLVNMKEIFYWKTVELTAEQYEEIGNCLNSPLEDAEGVTIKPLTTVDLNCFSTGELNVASERGPLRAGVGGQLTFSNFIFTEV